jgi:hypothetical protein
MASRRRSASANASSSAACLAASRAAPAQPGHGEGVAPFALPRVGAVSRSTGGRVVGLLAARSTRSRAAASTPTSISRAFASPSDSRAWINAS